MTTFARPLDRFPIARTRDPDEMRAALAQVYINPKLELIGRERTLDIAINHFRIRHTELSFGSYAADIHMEFPGTEFVSQIFLVRGMGEAFVGGTPVSIDIDRSLVISANESFRLTHNAKYERLIFKLDATTLTNKLHALTGESCNGPLKFHPAPDCSRPEVQALRAHFQFLVDKVSAPATTLPELMLVEFEQALMVMFLHANRHNFSHLLERNVPAAAPHEVRRAEEYIETNSSRPITLEDLAEVSGVSVFSLFRAFKKSRGYSPLEFAARVRARHLESQE